MKYLWLGILGLVAIVGVLTSENTPPDTGSKIWFGDKR
jgi:hypothetical protein